MTAAIDEVRPGITEDACAAAVQDGLDSLNQDIVTVLDAPSHIVRPFVEFV